MEPKRLDKTDTVTNKTEYDIGDFVEVDRVVVRKKMDPLGSLRGVLERGTTAYPSYRTDCRFESCANWY